MDVAPLAERFPTAAGSAGTPAAIGRWVSAVRRLDNVYIEFSGSDPHSGQVDYTVGQVGAAA